MKELKHKGFCILRCVALLLALVTLLLLVGCQKTPTGDGQGDGGSQGGASDNTPDNNEQPEEPVLDYSQLVIADYIESVIYKDMKIELKNANDSKQEAVWAAILETALIKDYPVDPVLYYFNQTKKLYMDAVNYNEDDYYRLLKSRGTDETKMLASAKAFVREDLIFYYIIEKEQISISDDEKQELFDKYVDKYVSDYGYKRIYVIANMSELIYESMLYDKTMEFLILNNTFEVEGDKKPEAQN